MGETKIEWTEATWNPVRGCTRVSEGCRNCYAEKYAARFSGPGLAWEGFAKFEGRKVELGDGRIVHGHPRWTGKVALIPEKLDEPLRWRKPCRVFVNSMSDLFHESLPDEAIDRVFAVMALAQRHTFQVLTKRPDRMRSWFLPVDQVMRRDFALLAAERFTHERRWTIQTWPLPNVWLGVSCEDQATADERIPLLLQTPAAVRFVSYEPALGPVHLNDTWIDGQLQRDCLRLGTDRHGNPNPLAHPILDWVITGGESGPGARPCDLAWIRSVRDQCKAAGVACFVKQLGARPIVSGDLREVLGLKCGHRIEDRVATLRLRDRKGGDPSEWPEDLRVREFPR